MSRSEKKGFHRFLPLIVLAAVLILAAAFVLLLPLIREKFPPQLSEKYRNDPTDRTIARRDPDALQSITVSQRNGETYTLVFQDGALALESADAEPEPIDAAIAVNFIKYATTVYVEDTIAQDRSEVAEYLSDMGLDPPQITVSVAYADGSVETISLGSALPGTTYHYYRWSGDDGVYLCNTGVYETFDYPSDMLFAVSQPPIVSSLIERVSISHGDGEPIVCVFESDGGNSLTGTLQSPFVYPMGAEAAEALFTAVTNFRLGARLKPITEENRAQYGLTTPQAVVKIAQREGLYSQTDSQGVLQSFPVEPSSVTLTIGDASGEFFRYCEYEGTCYRVSGFLVAAFLNADAENYLSLHPADMGAETMQSVSVQTGNGAMAIRAAYTENVLPNNELETDENGNIVYSVEVTANGDPVTAEAFDELVDRLRQMSVSGLLGKLAQPEGTPQWQLTLTTVQGKTRTLAAYPMDAFSEILSVDGVALSYISNEALEIALGEFAALPEATGTP